MRVVIVNNIPAPYFDPVFKILGERAEWNLTVCYTSSWNQQAGWVEAPLEESSYRVVILDRKGSGISAGYRLLRELLNIRPEFLIIYGYTLIPQCLSITWSILTGTPYALIGDANVYADKPSGVKGAVRNTWLRFVIRRARALIAIGTANRLFWERYGARYEQLFSAPYAVDNEHFKLEATKAKSQLPETVEKTVFLFAGRFIKRKNVDLIIGAFRSINSDDVSLIIVGDGPERERLEALGSDDERILFAGAVPQADLPLYYAISDCLVLPAANEPWGLVVNEAMSCGLAVIIHKECGAAVDLVTSENGVLLESFEQAELERAMQKVSKDPVKLAAMKAMSLERISGWTIDGAARGIIEAVEASIGGEQPSKREAVIGEVK